MKEVDDEMVLVGKEGHEDALVQSRGQ